MATRPASATDSTSSWELTVGFVALLCDKLVSAETHPLVNVAFTVELVEEENTVWGDGGVGGAL